MSSYKGHTAFAVILSFLMFYNPLAVALAVFGANFPDFDHEFRQNQVLAIFALGVITAVFLYFLNLPYYIGLILIILSLIFLFSHHRGFTHSIAGVIILGVLIFLLIFSALDLAAYFNLKSDMHIPINLLITFILLAFLGIFFLNKKIAVLNVIFIISSIFLINLGFLPVFKLNIYMVLFSIYLGLFSHLILDSFTPEGIRLLSPFHSRQYHKKAGLLIFAIIIVVYFVLFQFVW